MNLTRTALAVCAALSGLLLTACEIIDIEIRTPAQDGVVPGTDVSVDFTLVSAPAMPAATCQLDDAAPVPCTSPHVFRGVSAGQHRIIVSASNSAGLTDTDRVDFLVEHRRPVPVVQIEAGDAHTCALLETGAVRCWGFAWGGIGYGNEEIIGDDEYPSSVGDVNIGGGGVIQISAGRYHTCALLESRNVRCWGNGQYGQLGYGNMNDIGDDELPASAGDVPIGSPVARIVASGDHTCALLVSGGVRCWGRGAHGQLGYAGVSDIGDDELPSSASNVRLRGTSVAVAAGQRHTCAVTSSGNVSCWGDGHDGALGYDNWDNIGDDETPFAVGLVPVGAPVRDLSLGGAVNGVQPDTNHTCALLTTGSVRCWGYGGLGALGYGNTKTLPAPGGDVDIGGEVKQLAAGDRHQCAVLTNGKLRCWGYWEALGYAGLVNIGDDELPSTAGDVDVGADVLQVSAGNAHTCALLTNRRVRCWGQNHWGQLGYPGAPAHIAVPATSGDVSIAYVTPEAASAALEP